MNKKNKIIAAVVILIAILGFVGYMLFTGGFGSEKVHYIPDGQRPQVQGDVKQTALNYNALGFRVVSAGDDMCLSPVMLAANIGLYSEGAVDEGKEQAQTMLGDVENNKENHVAISNELEDGSATSFNGLVVDKKLGPTKEFVDVNKYYQSYFETADFYDFIAVKEKINEVVSSHTNGAIPIVLEEIRAQHSMIFVSGYKFNGIFGSSVGSATVNNKEFMGTATEYYDINSARVKLYEDDNALFISIPMEKGYEYELVMSKKGDISGYTLADIKGLRDKAEEKVVKLSLPATKSGGQFELKDPLKAVGFEAPFTKVGLIGGMSKHAKLKVDKIDQNIAFDIAVNPSNANVGNAVQAITVDKPYYYMVVHKATGCNVIMGKKTK